MRRGMQAGAREAHSSTCDRTHMREGTQGRVSSSTCDCTCDTRKPFGPSHVRSESIARAPRRAVRRPVTCTCNHAIRPSVLHSASHKDAPLALALLHPPPPVPPPPPPPPFQTLGTGGDLGLRWWASPAGRLPGVEGVSARPLSTPASNQSPARSDGPPSPPNPTLEAVEGCC